MTDLLLPLTSLSQTRSAAQLSTAAPPALRIPIASGTGRGPTELAAFDAALVDAGIADRNLILLSSVIPPGSTLERVGRIERAPGGWGDRLYCVLAEARTSEPGSGAWAGIGWAQDETHRGVFVEHHAQTEQAVADLIDASLLGLARNRNLTFPSVGKVIRGAVCSDTPVCALVVAVYEASPWVGRAAG
jgi:arginine decarboxylase